MSTQALVLVATSFACAYARCPPGLIQGVMANDCYTVGQSLRWFDAQSSCLSIGGHLTIVRNAYVNNLLGNLTNACGITVSTSLWLGASIGVFSEVWTWVDGSSFTYTNWAKGNLLNCDADVTRARHGPTSSASKYKVRDRFVLSYPV